MGKSITPEALTHQVAIRLAALAELSVEELARLPEWSTERVYFGKTWAKLTTYSILRSDSSRSIVVQAMPEGTGHVWTQVQAAGFRVFRNGDRAPIGEPEIFEFT